jgi:hypothetical protein
MIQQNFSEAASPLGLMRQRTPACENALMSFLRSAQGAKADITYALCHEAAATIIFGDLIGKLDVPR